MSSKLAIITGGCSGIGLAIGDFLASQGWSLGILDVAEAKTKLPGTRIEFRKIDVTVFDAFSSAVDSIVKSFGGLEPILYVNNAGILGPSIPFEERNMAQHDMPILMVNVVGVMNGSRIALSRALRARVGRPIRVVNVASTSAAFPYPCFETYAASKAAVLALTRSLAAHPDYSAANIAFLALCPAFTATPMTSPSVSSPAAPSQPTLPPTVAAMIEKAGGIQDVSAVVEGFKALLGMRSGSMIFVTAGDAVPVAIRIVPKL